MKRSRNDESLPNGRSQILPNDTRPPHEWMPRSFQRRFGGGSVQRCFTHHPVGSCLLDAGDGDAGAGCGGGATDAVAPFASFEATCGPTTFSARGGSESLLGAHTPNQWSETDRMAPVVGKRRAKRRKAPPWVQKRGLGSSNPICERSGRWDSNPRPSAWQADALPLSYARIKTSSTVT